MVIPAQLDPKIPTRSVDFIETLQILKLSAEKPRTYTDLLNLASGRRIILGRDGRVLKKSSFHRNWKTLEVLGLIEKENHHHRPTPAGHAVLVAFTHEGGSLGEQTKKLLRKRMLASEIARRNFFDLFATGETCEPLEYTAALALLPTTGDSQDKASRRQYRIVNIETGIRYDLPNRQVQGIIWGLGSWAMQLGLADQLSARPQDGVSADLSKIVFLINPDRSPEEISKQFALAIENIVDEAEPAYGVTVRLPISWLFYRVCPAAQISTATARQELIKWLALNGSRAFVEGASRPVVKSVRRKTRSGSRIDWKHQEPALLEIDGRYYTYLFCQKRSPRKDKK